MKDCPQCGIPNAKQNINRCRVCNKQEVCHKCAVFKKTGLFGGLGMVCRKCAEK